MADENNTDFDFVDNSKGKSVVWGYFRLKRKRATKEIEQGVGYCKRCNDAVKCSGGISNLFSHLERHHKIVLSTSQGKGKHADVASQRKLHEQPTLVEMCQKLEQYRPSSDRSKNITDKIAMFIVKDLRPFSVVSNEGFRALVQTLDPRYTIPSRTYFSETAIPDMYDQVKADVKLQLSKASSVALTTDGWTSRATESYVTITSTHISDDWQMHNYVLQTRELPLSHTGENIANVLKDAINEWGLPECSALVTDNAANMLVAAKSVGFQHHLGCYAHTLNLAAQKGLTINSVSRLLGHIRRIVSYFHRSTTAAAALKECSTVVGVRSVKLIQDVSTRWNSAVDMLERFLELQPAVYAALMSKEIRSKEKDLATLTDADVTLAENVMSVLIPLRTVSTGLCKESCPTASLILPLQKKLLEQALASKDTDAPAIRQLKQTIADNLKPR